MYSTGIKTNYAVDNCAITHIKRGKFSEGSNREPNNQRFIQCLTKQKTYKHLSIYENLNIYHKELIPEQVKAVLHAKGKITVINT